MFRKFLVPFCIVLFAILVISLLYASRPSVKKRELRPEPLVKVAIQKVDYIDSVVLLPSQGLVTAQTRSVLSAQVSGVVTTLNDRVRQQGAFQYRDVLIVLDDRDYQTALELVTAQLREAEVELQQEKARSEQAARDWQRLNQQKKPNDLVLRKPQLMAARARLAAVEAQVAQAKLNLERTRIRAPFTGSSTQLHVGLGQYVTPGTPLAEVVSTQNLEVVLAVSSQWRHLLPSKNEDTEVVLQSQAGEAVPAKLVRQADFIDPNNRQLKLVASIDKQHTGSSLIAGDFVSARIKSKALKNVAVLPVASLVNGDSVWELVDGRLQKRQVNIVWKDSQHVYIDSGLEQNAMVNITALAHVVSGTRVELLDASRELAQ